MTKRIDEIAKTERLTQDVLTREIISGNSKTPYFKEKADQLLDDFHCISCKYDLDERVIVYCFIRLWQEIVVYDFNFYRCFNLNYMGVIREYIKHYYDNLYEIQESLWR